MKVPPFTGVPPQADSFLDLLDPSKASEPSLTLTWEPWFILVALFLAGVFWEIRRRNTARLQLESRLAVAPEVLFPGDVPVRNNWLGGYLRGLSEAELLDALAACRKVQGLTPGMRDELRRFYGRDHTLLAEAIVAELSKRPTSTSMWDHLDEA